MIDRRHFVAGGLALGAAPLAARTDAVADAADRLIPAGFQGALLVARDGRTVLQRHYGYADVARRAPVTAATRFALGSGSKWLTSVAVLRLVEAGKLALDMPLTRALPGFRADTGARVTLAHLLSNTSGIPDGFARAARADPTVVTTPATPGEMVARYAGGDLAFVPGSAFDYAATNWIIVAAIVEHATGKPIATAMRELVFAPLRLASAANAGDGWATVPDTAHAYASLSPPAEKMATVPAFLAASGNVVATPADAARAAHAIFAGRFLSPASRAALTTVRWPVEDYALGGRVHMLDGQRWAWETGKVQAYRAHVAHRLDGAPITIALFNTTDMAQAPIGAIVEGLARAAAMR